MRDKRVFKGDTALVTASLYADDGVTPLTATAADIDVRQPDGTVLTNTIPGVSETDIVAAWPQTTQVGQYQGVIRFTLAGNGQIKSVPFTFEVIDPLESTAQATTPKEIVIDRAWMKLEDLFDSELGGPHLRDRTLAGFDRNKLARFLPDALYNINNYYQPAGTFTEETFPTDQHGPLLSQALLIEAMYHLRRSYVEQWTAAGAGQPTYFDRRDYMNRWDLVLRAEEERFNVWMDLFKRGQMDFGNSALLVGGYATSGSRIPRYMRGRFPYVYRW
jgi:hypothetical protein